jgi:hypothetical protein
MSWLRQRGSSRRSPNERTPSSPSDEYTPSPGNGSSIDWKYTAGTRGTVTFTANYGAGSYQAYYLYNDGYTILAGPVGISLT